MQTLENLLLCNYLTEFLDIALKIVEACVIKVCSNGSASYIILEITVKNNLNTANLMQAFQNLLLQKYLTEF